jgi:hypothetical protein
MQAMQCNGQQCSMPLTAAPRPQSTKRQHSLSATKALQLQLQCAKHSCTCSSCYSPTIELLVEAANAIQARSSVITLHRSQLLLPQLFLASLSHQRRSVKFNLWHRVKKATAAHHSQLLLRQLFLDHTQSRRQRSQSVSKYNNTDHSQLLLPQHAHIQPRPPSWWHSNPPLQSSDSGICSSS